MTREPRNPRFEAEIVTELAARLGVRPEPILALAQHRSASSTAITQYGAELPEGSRHLEVEALEELSDCANYIVWRLDQIHRGLVEDEERTPHLQLALAHVVSAFEELRKALR